MRTWEAALDERGHGGVCESMTFDCLDVCIRHVVATCEREHPADQAPCSVVIAGSLHLVGGALRVLGVPCT